MVLCPAPCDEQLSGAENKAGGDFHWMTPYIANKKPGQVDESTDTWDTIEWLLKNVPNNNGRVGIYGTSFPGHYAAQALIDPKSFAADKEGTPYLAPQVLVDVNHGMLLMSEETFGPAIGIMPVKGDEQAVELMNDSRYGLTASIWTADADAALAIGERVDTGTWFMNRCDYLDPALAWTGVKDSGRGCTLSRLGLEAFTRPKSFHLKLTP